jgi:hypothetical protein
MGGLSPAAVGRSAEAIVGQPADLYTQSYYGARAINGFGAFVLGLLESITRFAPTSLGPSQAVWGPFGDPGEPNVWRLTIDRAADSHFDWRLEGKPRSATDAGYLTIAGGTFVPEQHPFGRGLFNVDFETLRSLNPTETGRGRIVYAYLRDSSGTRVAVHAVGVDAQGAPTDARYAFGIDPHGVGFILLDAASDAAMNAKDLLIHTRWLADGTGRADVVAADQASGHVLRVSQCWNSAFVSTFEQGAVDGTVAATSGDATSCGTLSAEFAAPADLPDADQGQTPAAS